MALQHVDFRSQRTVKLPLLMETHDVAELIEISTNAVRLAVLTGRLMPVAITPRGVRLFHPDDVQVFKARRELRRAKAQEQEQLKAAGVAEEVRTVAR